ncbi:EpsG-like putative glucosyltransferase [Raoultella sp. BIGb0149]|uniref:EpsG family protein n=1 Tax=Raoultella sp. BIGb0149 TaxID=2485116 RepID=UPI00105DA8EE|nr:EpsG family protein [Raoultella sp. BIGb0149]TDQ24896.1 EpsG-like putative glucosyltransferase [Raoultella sp. BIGb0149]
MLEDRIKLFKLLFHLISLAVFVLFAGISPILGFYVVLICLALNFGTDEKYRYAAAIIAIFCCSFIIASRNFETGLQQDDFANIYYLVFKRMQNGDSVFYDQFSGGIEFFLPLYFKIIGYVFDVENPVYVMAYVAGLCLLLFYIWLEKYGLEGVEKSKRSLCVASSLGLLVFLVTTQNMRQAISCGLLLFAITFFIRKQKIPFLSFLILAIIAHTTSIIVFVLFIIFLQGTKFQKKIVLFMGFIALLIFNALIGFIISHGLLGAATYKLLYYTTIASDGFNLGYLKFFIIMCAASYFFFSEKHQAYKQLIWYGTLLYAILLPIPILSQRLLLLLVAFLNGYLMFFSFYKILNVYRILLIFYFMYRLMSQGPLFAGYGDDGAFMDLWYSYSWIGNSLFYYIK